MFVSPHDDDVVIGAGSDVSGRLGRRGQVHVVVVTDGRMGYCRFEQRRNITKIRRAEAEKSFQLLGLPLDHLRFIECPDCNLNAYRGRHFTTIGAPTEIEGAGGMQNAFTHALRQVRPNRVFLATSADLHPDHQIVHEEVLDQPVPRPGQHLARVGAADRRSAEGLRVRLLLRFPRAAADPHRNAAGDAGNQARRAILAYASQEQIETVVAIQRNVGPIEYLRELEFHFYHPQQYHALFARKS